MTHDTAFELDKRDVHGLFCVLCSVYGEEYSEHVFRIYLIVLIRNIIPSKDPRFSLSFFQSLFHTLHTAQPKQDKANKMLNDKRLYLFIVHCQ